MRPLLLIVAAVAVLVAVVAPGSRAQDRARASGSAAVVERDPGGRLVAASAEGTDDDTATGRVDVPGATVREGEASARSSTGGAAPTVRASAVARSVSLLGGRVTAFGVRRTATIGADGRLRRSGRVDGLRIDGKLLGDVTKARRFTLSGGGVVTVNTGASGLRVQVLTATGGVSAGGEVRVAVVRASAREAAAPTPAPTPTATATATATPEPTSTPEPSATPKPKRRKAPSVQTRLTRSGFAFPVYGDDARVADNYATPRPAPIGSHEGVDIFAPFGTPVVAVADGRLSKVGTLPISGNRLWLTTKGGDSFFYAHLSAFASGARDGREVEAGTVLGFTGNTGDAEPTPPHVHFEVHPGGIDAPSVDPYPIVTAWQGRDDVAPGAFLRRGGADTATRPGSLVVVRDPIAE